ncbi:MAG TPA: hypothetical protein ENI23_16050 [bacterium]|nr:hypothetical protein [bacterium]
MENQNTGSFGAAISNSPGDLTALKQVMASRGMDTSALDQVSSGGSPSGQIVAPQPVDPQAAQIALSPTEAPTTPSTPTVPDSDNTIAMKALATVVTNDSKMKRDLVNLRTQGVV